MSVWVPVRVCLCAWPSYNNSLVPPYMPPRRRTLDAGIGTAKSRGIPAMESRRPPYKWFLGPPLNISLHRTMDRGIPAMEMRRPAYHWLGTPPHLN